MTEQFSLSTAKYFIYCRHNKQYVVRIITSGMGSLGDLLKNRKTPALVFMEQFDVSWHMMVYYIN